MRWLLIALVAVPLFQLPPHAEVPLAGHYTVTGTNEDGSQYTGTAAVTEDNGLVSVQMFNGGELATIAICLRDGLIVSCIFQTRDGVIGLSSYTITRDTWTGRWHVPGSSMILKEVLTRADPRLHGAEHGPRSVL